METAAKIAAVCLLGALLTALLKKAGYRNIEILKDLAGLDRVALGWRADEQQEE